MSTWIVFYDRNGNELAAYTECGTFAGELQATKDLLAFERSIPAEDISIKVEQRGKALPVFPTGNLPVTNR